LPYFPTDYPEELDCQRFIGGGKILSKNNLPEGKNGAGIGMGKG